MRAGLRSLPESLGALQELEELFLFGNPLLRCLPRSLAGLRSLRCLSVGACDLGSLPEGLCAGCGRLQDLHVSKNARLGRLPRDVGALAELRKLSASGCGLTSLPDSLGQCARLEELFLYGNKALRSLRAAGLQLRSQPGATVSLPPSGAGVGHVSGSTRPPPPPPPSGARKRHREHTV